jgi:hypothetical protein
MKKLKLFALTAVALMGVTGVANAETATVSFKMTLSEFHSGLCQWRCLAVNGILFLLKEHSVPAGWRVSITVAGLVTGIAFIHYMYMRDVWVS